MRNRYACDPSHTLITLNLQKGYVTKRLIKNWVRRFIEIVLGKRSRFLYASYVPAVTLPPVPVQSV